MAGSADLQPSKNAKSATCKKKQGAGGIKKKQSCNKNETDHKDKQFNDTSGKTKEVEGGKTAMEEKEDDDDNRDRDLAINKEEKVLKKNDKFSVNQNNEDGKINVSEKCCNAYYEKGSLQKNEVHQKKDSSSKEADSCMKGIAGIEKIKENLNFKDITEKEKDGLNNGVAQSSKAVSDGVDEKKNDENIERNEVVGATKGKEKDIHNNNIESTKKDTEVPVKDVKNAKESDKKEERNKASSSNLNKNSPKKSQFGYNYRGRGFYGNNRGENFEWRGGNNRGRGRNFEWRGGWGYNNYNNRFHNQRMMNSGPSSAYRGHRGDNHQSRNYRDSAAAHTKTPCPSNPEDILPPAFPGPLQPVYFNNQLNYQDCYYFPQLWSPPQQSEQTLQGEAGATTYYQGSTEISSIHANSGQTEAAAHYDAEYIQSAEKAETNGMINLSPQQYLGNPLSGQTETNKEVNVQGHEKMSNIIASVSSNPLLDLGKSAEEDKQLVQTFAGIEMRPSIQLPPDYGLQWYFIPYGAALPPSVIPVMVVPYLNSADSPFNNSADSMVVPFHNGAGNCNTYLPGQGGNCPQDQGFSSLQRHGDGGQHQGFPPPYFNNVDVPSGSAQTPSQVGQLAELSTSRETYQPGVRTWTH